MRTTIHLRHAPRAAALRPLLLRALALLALLPARPARADWKLLKSGNGQDAGYFQVSAAGSTDAMAVGTHDDGMGGASAVLAVTQDGVNWTTQTPKAGPAGFIEMYTSVHMVSTTRAFVGSLGKLLKTGDGGRTWSAYVESGWSALSGPTISGISFSGDTGFLVGSNGTIRRTTDGGLTWIKVASPVAGLDYTGVRTLDGTRVWAWAGRAVTDPDTKEVMGYEDGALIRSIDGGATFAVVFQGESRAVAKGTMADASEGFLISNALSGPRLEKTTDGGATWSELAIPAGSGGAPDAALDVFFFDRCEGFLLVEKDKVSRVLRTTDGGASFADESLSKLKVPNPFGFTLYARLASFDFPSRERGFAGGFHESLAAYSAAGPGPECSGGGGGAGGGSGSGGRGTGCRTGGPGNGGLAIGLALALLALRRRGG